MPEIERYELRSLIIKEACRLKEDRRRETHPAVLLTEIFDDDPMRLEAVGIAGETEGTFVRKYIEFHKELYRNVCKQCRQPKNNSHLGY